MEGRRVNLNIQLPEGLWRDLRRLAERERGPTGRASVTFVVNRLIAEGLDRRNIDRDPRGRETG